MSDQKHEIFMEADLPMFRRQYSCGEKTTPIIAGEAGVREAFEKHPLAVFGPKVEEG